MKRWPDGSTYVEAVQNFANLGDRDIQLGSYEQRQNGLPKPYSGGFTTTFHFTTSSGAFAVRCFTRGNEDLERRYQAITEFLKYVQHPAFCQADYLPNGILVNAMWWPIIKMQWVAGCTLNVEVEQSLNDPSALRRHGIAFRKLVGALGVLGVAHGDLQHGNIIVANGELRLIDYDGIYLPALAGMLPSEFGHQNYQHPQRKDASFDGRLDRFSSIVIYTALKALEHDSSLWQRFNNDENILFRATDFTSHGASDIFKSLLANANIKNLAQQLVAICDNPVANVPTLEQVIAAAALPNSPPIYSAFSTSTPNSTQPNLPSQQPQAATAQSAPLLPPMTTSTRSGVPQPFSMPTVRVQANSGYGGATNTNQLFGTQSNTAPSFCGKCGNSLLANSSFCAKCGSVASPSGQSQAVAPGTRYIGQWNWGAFALTPFWLMTHRRVAIGLVWAILSFVPVINIIGAIYFGCCGTRIAVSSGRFRDEQDFVAVQNAWRNWGIGLIIVLTLLTLSNLGSSHSN